MSFQAPLFLLGLAVVPAGAGRPGPRPAAPGALRRALPGRPDAGRRPAPRAARWRRAVPPALLSLALAGLVLALARPEATIAVPVERASVVLVTDTSGSMEATDVAPVAPQRGQGGRGAVPRPRAGRAAGRPRRLLGRRPHRPGPDPGPRRGARDAGRPGRQRRHGHRRRARRRPARSRRARPGKDRPAGGDRPALRRRHHGRPRPGWPSPARRARPTCPSSPSRSAPPTARSRPRTGQILPVPPDPEALREIAQLSGGRAFAAEDADALDAVYEGLGSRIGTREERREVSAGFAAAGLLLLAGAVATACAGAGACPEGPSGRRAWGRRGAREGSAPTAGPAPPRPVPTAGPVPPRRPAARLWRRAWASGDRVRTPSRAPGPRPARPGPRRSTPASAPARGSTSQ